MQSKAARRVRHLLVSAGVICLVVSAAAPAALAARSEGGNPHERAEHPGLGTNRTLVCHGSKVLEIDDDALDAHVGHGDHALAAGRVDGDPCPSSSTTGPVDDGTGAGDPGSTGGDGGGSTGLGGGPTTDPDGGTRGGAGVPAGGDGVDRTDPARTGGTTNGGAGTGGLPGVEDSTAGGTGNRGAGTGGTTTEQGDPAPAGDAPELPAPQVQPLPIISTKTVTRPDVPATPTPTPATPTAPAAPAALATTGVPSAPATPTTAFGGAPSTTRSGDNEVLGAVTTRTPTIGAGVLDAGARTTSLAATGLDSTSVLAVLGSVLLLSGLGLVLVGRTRVRRTV